MESLVRVAQVMLKHLTCAPIRQRPIAKRCSSCAKTAGQMTKKLISVLLLTITFCAQGQNVDQFGLDNNPTLNNDEAAYLTNYFSKRYPDMDFKAKKVGFFIGSSNYRIWTKKEYFDNVKDALKNGVSMQDQLLILNEIERAESGGYDFFVISWSKLSVTNGRKKTLISKIVKSDKDSPQSK